MDVSLASLLSSQSPSVGTPARDGRSRGKSIGSSGFFLAWSGVGSRVGFKAIRPVQSSGPMLRGHYTWFNALLSPS